MPWISYRRICAVATFAVLHAPSDGAIAQGNSAAGNVIATVVDGNFHRLKLLDNEQRVVEAEYPEEELRYQSRGRVDLAFRIGGDGSITELVPGTGAFFDAAARMVRKLRFSPIAGAWPAPVNYYVAVVTFTTPPCFVEPARLNTDYGFTVCAGADEALSWQQHWPSGPVYPAALNRSQQGDKLQFLGTWQPGRAHFGTDPWTYGVIKIAVDGIRGLDGHLVAAYSIVAQEEYVAVLKVTSAEGEGVYYWRLDAVDYSHCQTAADDIRCAKPYDNRRVDQSVFQNVDDALSFNRTYVQWSALFPYEPLDRPDRASAR